MKLLTVVIPCFNEANSLPKLIMQLSAINSDIEFLLINNGSTDGSKAYLNNIDLKSNISVFHISKNEGYGHGVYTGLKSISNSMYLGWIHGDLQFEFDKLEKLCIDLKKLSLDDDKIFYKGVRSKRNFLEKLFSKLMEILASLILGEKFHEINAQPTIFSRDLLLSIDNPPKDFSFDTYIYWLALKENYKIVREKFLFPKREYGKSNWNFGLRSRISFGILLMKYFIKLRKLNS
jgi:polyisoprenyl-phosphate glycosyltransferase